VTVHLLTLILWNFGSFPYLDMVADHALTMIMIPMVGILGGRLWPYLVCLPIVALPIASKAVRQLVDEESAVSLTAGYAV
jgi:hypothetical protein